LNQVHGALGRELHNGLPAQLIEESRHSDIANARDEIEDQTQPAVSEEDDYSRQYGDQIKNTGDCGFETW
jgi:hypothetical protein